MRRVLGSHIAAAAWADKDTSAALPIDNRMPKRDAEPPG